MGDLAKLNFVGILGEIEPLDIARAEKIVDGVDPMMDGEFELMLEAFTSRSLEDFAPVLTVEGVAEWLKECGASEPNAPALAYTDGSEADDSGC